VLETEERKMTLIRSNASIHCFIFPPVSCILKYIEIFEKKFRFPSYIVEMDTAPAPAKKNDDDPTGSGSTTLT
jgi:hypothetical protein